jgi:hypothetical protein
MSNSFSGSGAARAVLGQEPPPDERHERHARDRHGAADGREGEHAVALADLALAEARDEDVRRGADQGHEAAEDRAERQRHERDRRRVAVAVGLAERDRQHERQRAHVVHERGQDGDDRRLDDELGRRPALERRQQRARSRRRARPAAARG